MKTKIRKKAQEEGFEVVGFTHPKTNPKDINAMSIFLKKGWHGDMKWMARELHEHGNPRGNPLALMPEARSIIVLGANYGPQVDPLEVLSHPDQGAVSVYARTQKDYHEVLKKRLKRIARWLKEMYPNCDLKIFTDTAPIMEKPLAARAGIGWQGKHSNLVSRQFGSWLFLSEIITTLEIEPDKPEIDHCGSCNLCMKACPTNAIIEPYKLDARRCISYLTIEHKGPIKPAYMSAMGNRIYGCDDCLAVCPWTKFSFPASSPELRARSDLATLKLKDLISLKDNTFRNLFSGSAIKRTGRSRFIRNVLIAVANSGNKIFVHEVEKLTEDESLIVANTARWALKQLTKLDEKITQDTLPTQTAESRRKEINF